MENLGGRRFRGRHFNVTAAQTHRKSSKNKPDRKPTQLLEWEHLHAGVSTYELDTDPNALRCGHAYRVGINVFSHIIGALVFLALPMYVFRTEVPPRYKFATMTDIFVCSTYFLGVGICFTFSTLFHTFMCHSETVYSLGIKLDYQGILLLIWGANVPLIYYSMPCDLGGQVAYWTLNTALAGLCSLATFHPSIGGPHLGHVRAGLFATFGFCSVIAPIFIGILKHGFEQQSRRVGLGWIGATALCDGIGVVCYAMKFPERWYPRTFDLFGASHQVMHVTVVLAALSYTKAMLQAFDFHHQYASACADHISHSNFIYTS
ncbi:hemolysin-III channel protein-like protein Izh2 [Hypoxylon sp. NC0597]|nr:hemolysin-III channel protein-like protein Izh2 [Hypoxylon sp. NC0597]